MRSVVLTLLFSFFLYPVSAGEYSVNYSFVLFPLAVVIARLSFSRPPGFVSAALALYTAILFYAILLFPETAALTGRRVISFLLFISVFSFAFIRIDETIVRAFKRAVVLVSVGLSAWAVVQLVGLQAVGPVHFEVKELIGSQRMGFVYLFGFWIALLDRSGAIRSPRVRYGAAAIILAGVLLTFSRSSIVALGGTLILFSLVRLARLIRRSSLRAFARAAAGSAAAVGAAFLAYRLFPLTLDYYMATLVQPLLNASLFTAAGDTQSSEGIRVVRITETLRYVGSHPFTGTGYLGFWTVSLTGGGSAHNQYTDVLLRVGVAGFAFYVYLLTRLTGFLRRTEPALFWGFLGALIYGLFHETFKESQGAFLLTMPLGMLAEYSRSRPTYLTRQPMRAVPAATVSGLPRG